MHTRWLASLGMILLAAGLTGGQTQRIDFRTHLTPVGHLVPAADIRHGATPRPTPYVPQPGDIILYDSFNKFFHLVFKFANTTPPTHVALVIAGTDGKPALLELVGPTTITAKVAVVDVETRLRSYSGDIMVRRIRTPLTPQQSRELTEFAHAQSGKSFALGRVILQATPFCPRTGLRQALFGHTYLDRNRWFCSELVVAGCAKAGIVDGRACCGNATYPRDLAFDDWINLSHRYYPAVAWSGR